MLPLTAVLTACKSRLHGSTAWLAILQFVKLLIGRRKKDASAVPLLGVTLRRALRRVVSGYDCYVSNADALITLKSG